MKFGPVPLDRAEGAILAHSIPLPGGRLRKGLVLEAGHLGALREAGLHEVIVARLAPDDASEDEAAGALARALAGPGVRLAPVGTGRVNLMAEGPGIARIAAARVHAVNAADPAITLATVPEWARIEGGGMLATVKIVAYGVARGRLALACAAGQGAVALAAPRLRRALLIETVIGADEPGPKGHAVTAERLARLDVELAAPVRMAHRTDDLAAALRDIPEGVELVLVLTGSATSDPDDVCPAAIRAAGGRIERFGMPVDPGNLLVLGSLGHRPVVGLPGCARSPALNGADWVLERLVCGVPVGSDDIARMGVGGLLKEIPSRPRPRRQGHQDDTAP
jgi:molybdenum cofactor cytidylyltransferase